MTKRISYFSALRAVSCIAVVFLHMFYLSASGFETTLTETAAAMIVRNSMLWAVPCFVMVSGALLLDPARELSIGKVFRKYISRIIRALLIFTFVFSLFDGIVNGTPLGTALIRDFFLKLWTNGSWPHMWYLYMLLGLYLMLPLYRLVSEKADDRLLRYVILLFFLFLSVLPTIGYISGRVSGFYILSYTVYPFFFFMGYALHTEKLRIPLSAAVLMTAAGTVCLIVITYFSVKTGNDSLRTMSSSYAFSAVAVQTGGIFAIFHDVGARRSAPEEQRLGEAEEGSTEEAGAKTAEKTSAGMKALLSLDANSFGIYLIHMLVLNVFFRILHLNPYELGGFGALVLLTLANVFISYAVTRLLRLIPAMRSVL